MEISYIIEILLTAGISVITFLMKRTINELDSELDNCKRNIAQIKEDYITKEDFFREQNENRRKLDRIMDILLEVKGEIGKWIRKHSTNVFQQEILSKIMVQY